ncbi:hypothetical protein F1728_19285 [Gimesia benthica]|uniref:Uncharacterized protein n=1 Tax=Gimesia benthica TaxID=2608982 RepID=A0A6I6AKJ8_9PLAN|nr:hypothetical protein F1728_19285 [Gimesia benthica]
MRLVTYNSFLNMYGKHGR